MPSDEQHSIHQLIHQGLSEAQHQMLREKAKLNQTVVRCDADGSYYEQSAREALAELYNEQTPEF